jgi:hypothetical protein
MRNSLAVGGMIDNQAGMSDADIQGPVIVEIAAQDHPFRRPAAE